MRMFIAVAAAIAATSVSFAVATAANQPVGQTSATDKAVVNQLKTLNRSVNALNSSVGSSAFAPTGLRKEIRESSDDLEAQMKKVCLRLADYSFQC
jgi:hypothetical protein